MVDWKERTLSHWDKINALAARRFGSGPLAEEAALEVLEGLALDDWQRVRAYAGQASFVSFILTISARLLEDFARKRFGRVRPPLWVKVFGGFWLRLFQALCLERVPMHDAVELVHQCQQETEKAAIETAAYELLARIPDCGMAQGLEVAFEDEMPLGGDDGRVGLAGRLEDREQQELFRAIFQLALGREEDIVNEELLGKYRLASLGLVPEEKLLLKLCFQDELRVSDAGKMLGMNRFQAHGRMRRLLARLQTALQDCNLGEALRPMLEE